MKSSFPLDRRTRQREILIELLERKNWHPSAEELHQIVQREIPAISLGTIYRNMEKLAKKGAITVIEEAGLHLRYDGNPKPHYHIKCLGCGLLSDVPDGAVKWVENPLLDMPDFTVTGHKIMFSGFCSKCRLHGVGEDAPKPERGNETALIDVNSTVEVHTENINDNPLGEPEYDETRTAESLQQTDQ